MHPVTADIEYMDIDILTDENWPSAVERWLRSNPGYETVAEATYVQEGDKLRIPVRKK